MSQNASRWLRPSVFLFVCGLFVLCGGPTDLHRAMAATAPTLTCPAEVATVPGNPLGVEVHCRVTFPQPVTTTYRLRCMDLPGGVHCRFRPTEVPLPEVLPFQGSTDILLTVDIRQPAGTVDLVVAAENGQGQQMQTTVRILIQAATTAPQAAGKGMLTVLSSTTPGMRPQGVQSDAHTTAGTTGDGNGILEVGERVVVNTAWANTKATGLTVTGAAGSMDAELVVVDGTASFGTVAGGAMGDCWTQTGNCYVMQLNALQNRPLHWDVTFQETLSTGETQLWGLHVGESFTDVPRTAYIYGSVEALLHHGVTAGCGGGQFCPNGNITRNQWAIFVGRAMDVTWAWIPEEGWIPDAGSYDCSPGGTSLFSDVAPEAFHCKLVHFLYLHKAVQACAPGRFCGGSGMTRKLMARWLASAMLHGIDQVPAAYADPETNRSYDCADGQPNHFPDVPDDDGIGDCKYIHYLWARGVVIDGEFSCPVDNFCPNMMVTRGQAAVYIARAFGLRVTPYTEPACPDRPWLWGQYDWLAQRLTKANIDNVVDEKTTPFGFRGFRTFVQGFFSQASGGTPPGRQPYVRTANGKFDLNRWDNTYWRMARYAIARMLARGYRKILLVLGHSYLKWCQKPNGTIVYCSESEQQPWENNIQGINLCDQAGQSASGGSGQCEWMLGWSTLATSTCAGMNCQEWVINEYRRLVRQYRLLAGDALVVEIYNEAIPNSEIEAAHQALIAALRDLDGDDQEDREPVRVQVNIDPAPTDVTDQNACPDYGTVNQNPKPPFQQFWDTFINDVDAWAVHGLRPECLAEDYGPDHFFWEMYRSGKLEISTDGQYCIRQINNQPTVGTCCHCCHVAAGELLDDLIERAPGAGWHRRFMPVGYEHNIGIFRQSYTPSPEGIQWQPWEMAEIGCLHRRWCRGQSCAGTTQGVLMGRTTGGFRTTPPQFIVNPNTQLDVFWNSTFSNAQNAFTCTVSSPVGETRLQGCSPDVTAGCGTTTVRLTCGGTVVDTLRWTTCGNGTCDTACENEQNCPEDCAVCNFDGDCDQGEDWQGCIDCARTDIRGRPPGGSSCGDVDFTVQPDQTYTICWIIDAPATSDCTIVRSVNNNPFADWKDPDVLGRRASATDRIVSLPDMCQVDGDCGDPNFYDCVTKTKVETREYNARCSEGGVNREDRDTIVVTASYTRKECERTGQ